MGSIARGLRKALTRNVKPLASLAVGGAFIYWFAHRLNWVEVWSEVKTANRTLLITAMVLMLASYFIRSIRWRTLLMPMASPPLRTLFRATIIGFSAMFVMGRAVEFIVRPAVLSIKGKVHPSASYATVMIERVFDMVMIVVFFSVSLVFMSPRAPVGETGEALVWIKITGAVLLACSIAGIYGLSVFRSRRKGILSHLDKSMSGFPEKLRAGILSLLRHISEGLAVLHDVRSLSITVSHTVLLWFMVALAHLLVIRAFDIPYSLVSLSGAVFVMGISLLGSVVPTPGGAAGPFHTLTAAGLLVLGVSQSKAASVAIVLHLVVFAPATLLGLLYLIKDGLSLDRLRRFGERREEEASSSEEGEVKDRGESLVSGIGSPN